MRLFSTRVHGFLDYLVGALLVGLPWLLGFAGGGAETWAPVVVGAAVIAYSLCTDYELGLLRRLDMTVHLWLDAGGGLLLAISPWLFGFDQQVWMPHLLAGVLMVGVAVVSDTIPGYDRRRPRRTAAG